MTYSESRPLAVVTGASSGMGYELADLFAEAGYDLIVAAEDPGITTAAASFVRHGATDTEFFDRAGMQDTKLGAMQNRDDPRDVARDGFEALMAGKDLVVAGSFKNRAQAAAARVMPETAKAKIHAQISEPGSAS